MIVSSESFALMTSNHMSLQLGTRLRKDIWRDEGFLFTDAMS